MQQLSATQNRGGCKGPGQDRLRLNLAGMAPGVLMKVRIAVNTCCIKG